MQQIKNKENYDIINRTKQINIYYREKYTIETKSYKTSADNLLIDKIDIKNNSYTTQRLKYKSSHKLIHYRQRHGTGRGTHRGPNPRMESKVLEEMVRDAVLATRQDCPVQGGTDVPGRNSLEAMDGEDGIRPEPEHPSEQVHITPYIQETRAKNKELSSNKRNNHIGTDLTHDTNNSSNGIKRNLTEKANKLNLQTEKWQKIVKANFRPNTDSQRCKYRHGDTNPVTITSKFTHKKNTSNVKKIKNNEESNQKITKSTYPLDYYESQLTLGKKTNGASKNQCKRKKIIIIHFRLTKIPQRNENVQIKRKPATTTKCKYKKVRVTKRISINDKNRWITQKKTIKLKNSTKKPENISLKRWNKRPINKSMTKKTNTNKVKTEKKKKHNLMYIIPCIVQDNLRSEDRNTRNGHRRTSSQNNQDIPQGAQSKYSSRCASYHVNYKLDLTPTYQVYNQAPTPETKRTIC